MSVTKAGKRKRPVWVPVQMGIFELRKKLARLKQGKLLSVWEDRRRRGD